MSIEVAVHMKGVKCHKGHFYYIPEWAHKYNCPMCSFDSVASLRNTIDSLYRSKATLKGHITRLKNKLKSKGI